MPQLLTNADAGLLSLTEAGRRLDLSASRVRQLIDLGELGAVRTPLGRVAVAADVERMARERAERRER